MAKSTAQLINQDSGKTRYYTPEWVWHAARTTMRPFIDELGKEYSFELDAASDEIGNKYIGAMRYLTEELDALNHSWTAQSVWLNHPYSRSGNQKWINKAVSEHKKGNAKQICILTWASTSEKWAHPLFAYPICFLNKRVKFIDPNGALPHGATKSSMVTYLGPNVNEFRYFFSKIGHVMMPASKRDEYTMADYQVDAGRTSNGKLNDERRIMCGTVGLAEEAGEVLGLHKKWNYHGHPMDTAKLTEELGDTLWYLSETASSWDISLEWIAQFNIAKLRERYPDGFDRKQSLNRKR